MCVQIEHQLRSKGRTEDLKEDYGSQVSVASRLAMKLDFELPPIKISAMLILISYRKNYSGVDIQQNERHLEQHNMY